MSYDISPTPQYITIFLTFIGLIVFMLIANKKVKKFNHKRVESRFQVLMEVMFEYFEDIVSSMLGPERVRAFTPLAITIFLSILITNAASIVLLKEGAFLNPLYTFTWSLSMGAFWSFYAIWKTGLLSFIKNAFIGEVTFMAPIETLGFIIKPLSLGIRLMGNITAGAIIMMLVYEAPAMVATSIGGGSGIIVGVLSGVVVVPVGAALSAYFSLFGPFIQATVFTYITLANIASLLPEEE